LTPNGRLYARALGESFDLLSAATSRIAGERNLASLTIHMFPSLAVLWFMPQLSSWYERAPHVEITVATSIEPFAAPPQRGELVIGYELRKCVRPAAIVLFDEKIYPVCSPAYAAEYGSRAEGITQESTTLIQCQTAPEEWRHWFEAVDGAGVPPHRILNVDNRALALQAAASGLGIAMGRTPFAQQSIREGRLCRLFDRSQDSGYVYTLKVADGGKQSRVEKDFTAWLIEIAAASRE
jgi:DNA-binding transcriptional LysR family regulator